MDFTSIFDFIISISPLYWFIIVICFTLVWAFIGVSINLASDTTTDEFATAFTLPLLIPVFCLTASFMYHYDHQVKVENLNQISQWHDDATNFLSSMDDKEDNLKRKKTDRLKQLAPALTDAISEIEQNIKEDELRLFALKDVLIDYFSETGRSDYKLNKQYNDAGIYMGIRIGIDLDDNCVVKHIVQGSPAERANIQVGDKVVNIKGETVSQFDTSCFPSKLLRYLQGNYQRSFYGNPITFGIQPDKNKVKDPWGFIWFTSNDYHGGREIAEVTPGSQAEKAGLKVADIVIGYDGITFKSKNDFEYHLGNMSNKEKPSTTLNIVRNGSQKDLLMKNKYKKNGTRYLNLVPENITYFIDKDYVKQVNKINLKYSLLEHYKSKENFLYWEDKKASLTRKGTSEDLLRIIQDVNKTVERNKSIITIK